MYLMKLQSENEIIATNWGYWAKMIENSKNIFTEFIFSNSQELAITLHLRRKS